MLAQELSFPSKLYLLAYNWMPPRLESPLCRQGIGSYGMLVLR